jgi:hypothetical protein
MKVQTCLAIGLVLAMSTGCAVYFRPAPPPPPPPPPPPTETVAVGPESAPPPPAAEEAPPPPPAEEHTDAYDDQDPTALQDFHAALDPHGMWVDDPTYGYVWVPNPAEVGPDFYPYVSGGHWAYGDDNLWVSEYEWGWAPFHYGRWAFTDARGWAWIPGREYAPAWVEWRLGDEYVGWAPAPPEYVWRHGMAVTVGFRPPPPRYVFVGHGDFYSSHPSRVVVVGARAHEYEGRTRPYSAGGGGHFRHGPTPAAMHLPPAKVVHATGHEPGIARAKGFSRPATAEKLGAHPPARVATAGPHGQERTRAEPGHPEPGHAEPGHPEPGHTEPGHPEPGHATTKEATEKEPSTRETAPRETPAARAEEQAHPEPGHAEATHADATHAEPAHGEATQKEPSREAPRGESAQEEHRVQAEPSSHESVAHEASQAQHPPAAASHPPAATKGPTKSSSKKK